MEDGGLELASKDTMKLHLFTFVGNKHIFYMCKLTIQYNNVGSDIGPLEDLNSFVNRS